ncbi:MAG TPA: dipeptide/oligopeptide/nickel ABC transporter ATP-binding protein [Bacteroidota bacterium]|nr:dipeptide/oligopeptide/nickel ABC transporter ATP-binding protein [Bacteroidota bacterium]
MTKQPPALEVQDLVCAFTGGAGVFAGGTRQTVINGVSFAVGRGECLGLLGDSGSGKSTIARCIAGLAQPASGSISLLGTNIYPSKEKRKRLNGSIQMLYQDHAASLNPVLTIRASLMEAVRARAAHNPISDARTASAILQTMLDRVGLRADVLDRYPASLSGGERQRAALARSLAVDPAVLLLDEPTSALDTSTQEQILELIANLCLTQQTAVLFISHDIDAVARLCSHIAVLVDGCIVEHETTATVLAHPRHPYTRKIVGLSR